MRAVIVGAGAVSRIWSKILHDHPGVDVEGWVDVRPDSAAEGAALLGISPLITDNLAEALEKVRPRFVLDCTPPTAHRQVTETCLRAGVPVLGEKPMACSMADARAMVQTAEATGVLYAVSQSRRYDAALEAFRRTFELIGPPEILNADCYWPVYSDGFRDDLDSPLLLDMAIHQFDMARYLTGANAIMVAAESFRPSWSRWRGHASATVIFEMAGGPRFTYRGSWDAYGCPTSGSAEWRAVGPRGTAVWDGQSAPRYELDDGSSGEIATSGSPGTSLGGALEDFLRALSSGSRPMGSCDDNIHSLAMSLAAVDAARAGARLPVEV
jgi:predicted dehydrogenase